MKVLSLKLLMIAYTSCQILVYFVMCSDTPPPKEDKYIFKKEPSSPSTSSSPPPRNISPIRIWQDKHVVSEHASTSERQRNSSRSPSRQTPIEQVVQQQVSDSHNVQISQPTSSPQSPSSSSHGSMIQEDIRKRLRSSRRPRSPEENDKSRKVERETEIHSNRRHKRGGNRKRKY
jgi:hypothetical protein